MAGCRDSGKQARIKAESREARDDGGVDQNGGRGDGKKCSYRVGCGEGDAYATTESLLVEPHALVWGVLLGI